MENWLASGDKIDAVASNNDEMALGALMAIRPRASWARSTSADRRQPDALDSMDKGELNMTVFQDPVGQGEGAIEGAYLVAKAPAQPRPRATSSGSRTRKSPKENYKSFMKKLARSDRSPPAPSRRRTHRRGPR